MENGQSDKSKPSQVKKSFMTAGPTLHYSHSNVLRCWLLALCAYLLSCIFFSKIITGQFWCFDISNYICLEKWSFGPFVISPVSIFEYPWQIVVLGMLIGILAVVPILISQLMKFSYSIPFILSLVFMGSVPGFALSVTISSIAVACRPLRFRSRFISVGLCTAPQILYWGFFGGAAGLEPLQWGFSYTPWVWGWLTCIAMAGMVLGVGHFTRYKPGLVWAFTSLLLVVAVLTFEVRVGFAELDYQLYIAKNDPEKSPQFHDHSITDAIDETITDPSVKKYLFEGYFYPTEPILLRAELKEKIQDRLRHDRWPSWFIVPDELNYQVRRQELLEQYDIFIKKHSIAKKSGVKYKRSRTIRNRRMPIALYYQAMLNEYSLDINILMRDEILHFYSDYPRESAREIWYQLYREYSDSAESLEARWRVAKHWAGKGRFEQADNLLKHASERLNKRLKQSRPAVTETLFSPFKIPVDSVMTTFKLQELQRRIRLLRKLISSQNRSPDRDSKMRLRKFVMLNQHDTGYQHKLDELLKEMDSSDMLYDNIILAKTKLIADEYLRAEKLLEININLPKTDGGMEALYELGLLKIRLWRHQSDTNTEQKKKILAETRATLSDFISLYPNSIFTEQVARNLSTLPTVE